MNRHPRPVQRYPRMITRETIRNSTESNGSVNLGKVRDAVMNVRRAQTIATAKTKIETSNIFEIFKNAYREILNIEFKPIIKNRVVSYRNKNGKLVITRRKTDRATFVEFYKFLKNKYDITSEDFNKYAEHAIDRAVREFDQTKQTKIFGIVVSENIADSFFVKYNSRKVSKAKKQKQKEEHWKFFQ